MMVVRIRLSLILALPRLRIMRQLSLLRSSRLCRRDILSMAELNRLSSKAVRLQAREISPFLPALRPSKLNRMVRQLEAIPELFSASMATADHTAGLLANMPVNHHWL